VTVLVIVQVTEHLDKGQGVDMQVVSVVLLPAAVVVQVSQVIQVKMTAVRQWIQLQHLLVVMVSTGNL
jgi:hypothetical protein